MVPSNPSSESKSIDINLYQQTKQDSREPVAIVGIGCRFPGGASTPKAFWNMIRRKKDAIVDVPADRWDIRRFYDEDPAKPGKMYVKQGGFLKEKIDRFDPLFFGISPREAESMDPQQRLLLEVVWEAFEDAGVVDTDLKGSRTGVFIGGFCMDSMLMRFGQLNRELANSHSAASSTMTMLSNRISYVFDLKGPSVTMDTACSSSLVATHFGCQSIWSGESEMAIVGGVNVMLRPEFPIVMSKGKFLSPHGRCKAFDEDAAGYARGEGAGVVILKPLSAALKNRDRIYGLIKETGINQDGRTAGITLPDSKSQETLAKEVYRKAGVEPSKIDYVEAHGTGTQAGDPAEINALDKALGEGRETGRKCYVGSVKTNIGHLEAAAGVAGLIKAVLSLHHEKILPNLHFKNPSTKIAWDDVCIQIPTSEVEWKRSENVRYAGVNSFGYGGTNAHVLLQEAPAAVDATLEDFRKYDRPFLLPISARSEEALREVAGKYAFLLATNSGERAVADFFYSAVKRRTHHSHRAAVRGDSLESMRTSLQQFSMGEAIDQLSHNLSDANRAAKLVFVYTGMGPQWWAMGRELMRREPVFLDSLRKCDELFQEQAGWSILEELRADESDSRMARSAIAQPANFVIQVGLTELWKSWGVEPFAVVGHSVGEVASAYVSGALSLEDAITVSLYRSKLQQTLAGKGAMLAAGISEEAALTLIDGYDKVSIAAVNSPHSVTLSGDKEQMNALSKLLESEGRFNRKLDVEVAYHSGQMEPIKNAILEALKGISPQETSIPFFSTVEGDRIQGSELSANYWWKNVRQPVRFSQSVSALLADGCFDFLEVGPHPVLGHSIREIAAEANMTVRLTPSLHRKFPEQSRMLESLGQLYTHGQEVNWNTVIPRGGSLVPLPSYPWQKERYWIESPESQQYRMGQTQEGILNQRLTTPQPIWSVDVNSQFFPYLEDHRVNGKVVFPGAGYIEAALAIARELEGGESWVLTNIKFHSMLQLEGAAAQTLYFSYDEQSGSFYIHSRSFDGDENWQLHASGGLSGSNFASKDDPIDIEGMRQHLDREMPNEQMYSMLERRGLQYGYRFQRGQRIWLNDSEILVELKDGSMWIDDGYIIQPEVIDTAFHSLLTIIEGEQPFVPQKIGRVCVYKPSVSARWIYGKVTKRDEEYFYANIQLIDGDNEVCAEIRDVYMLRLPRLRSGDGEEIDRLLYTPSWDEFKLDGGEPYLEGNYILFASDNLGFGKLEASIQNQGGSCCTVLRGSEFRRDSVDRYQIDVDSDTDFDLLLEEVSNSKPIRILYLWPLDIEMDSLEFNDMVKQCHILIRLVKGLKKLEGHRCYLTIVTRGAQSLGMEDDLFGLGASPIGGLGQLFENECENVDCRMIDLDPSSDLNEDLRIVDRLLAAGEFLPNELAIRNGKTYSMTLQRYASEAGVVDEATEEISTEELVVLERGQRLDSKRFLFRRERKSRLEQGEIEIKTQSICINPRESSKLSSSKKSDADRPSYFGSSICVEVAGSVSQVGENVDFFSEGDRVVALVPDGIRSSATLSSNFAVRIPSFFESSDLFGYTDALAAYYAIVEIAKLKSGERVLIDEALDGVGLFAIQFARRIGAEVFAISGSPEMNDYLKEVGADHVLGSNPSEIVDAINSITGGEGIRTIMSVRSRGDLRQALSVLEPCGVFIEIRNPNSLVDYSLPRAVMEKNILFTVVDIDRFLVERPSAAKMMIDKVSDEFFKGRIIPIRSKNFQVDDFASAVRYLTHPDTVGNVVVEFEKKIVEALPFAGDCAERKTGTVIVTGGNSGFGLEVAKWLGRKTDCRIVLASRSGATSDEALETIDVLRKAGADVISKSIDVANLEQVQALTTQLNDEGPPICGIVHGAMVLDDAFIQDIDEQKLRKVMAPKILGVINLYRSVYDMDIEFFVSFSSVSSLIGNRGQANYVAANAFLDSFSRRLRAIGFPATSINWGALAESGVVARNEMVGKLLEKEGVIGISNKDALSAMDLILTMNLGQVGVFNVDWEKWRDFNARVGASTRFASIMKAHRKSGQNDKSVVLIEVLDGMDDVDKQSYLTNLVVEGLSRVLKVHSSKINLDDTLSNLGIDSLMLIELSLTIRSEFGLSILAAELPKYPTVKSLASNVQERLGRIRKAMIT